MEETTQNVRRTVDKHEPYEKPHLLLLGSVMELTEGDNAGGTDVAVASVG